MEQDHVLAPAIPRSPRLAVRLADARARTGIAAEDRQVLAVERRHRRAVDPAIARRAAPGGEDRGERRHDTHKASDDPLHGATFCVQEARRRGNAAWAGASARSSWLRDGILRNQVSWARASLRVRAASSPGRAEASI